MIIGKFIGKSEREIEKWTLSCSSESESDIDNKIKLEIENESDIKEDLWIAWEKPAT